MPIKLGQTYGHVKQNAFSNRVYFKPSLRKPVIRHPGVIRRSEKVLARNRKIAESPPAKRAHDACIKEHPEVGEVCPSELFYDYLSKEMSE